MVSRGVPIEVMIHFAPSALRNKLANSHDRIYNIEALEEIIKKEKRVSHWKQIRKTFNKIMMHQPLFIRDLVLKATGIVQKGLNFSNLLLSRKAYLAKEAL